MLTKPPIFTHNLPYIYKYLGQVHCNQHYHIPNCILQEPSRQLCHTQLMSKAYIFKSTLLISILQRHSKENTINRKFYQPLLHIRRQQPNLINQKIYDTIKFLATKYKQCNQVNTHLTQVLLIQKFSFLLNLLTCVCIYIYLISQNRPKHSFEHSCMQSHSGSLELPLQNF